jgi:quinol monooxygenase YgiN
MSMTARKYFLYAAVAASVVFVAQRCSATAPSTGQIVRIAELTIDSEQLDAYERALKEEISSSLRIEPGVLSLYAVSIKGHPDQIRILEIYRDEAAYRAHLQTTHFKKYKSDTERMVKSLTLIETEPILLGTK